MNVYTIQIAQWRLAKAKGIPLIDITVKSGNQAFAPTWHMLTLLKSGAMSEEEYTVHYLKKLRDDEWAHHDDWTWLLSHDTMALGCYCAAGAYCHRHVLVDFLRDLREKQGLPFNYCGEILPEE